MWRRRRPTVGRESDLADWRSSRPHTRVIKEDLFRKVLHLERRRSDRSNEAIAIFLVSIADRASVGQEPPWNAVIEAVAAAARETDVLGWIDAGKTLGLAVPELRACGPLTVQDIEARVRRELAERLDEEACGRCSIRLYLYSLPAGDEALSPWPANVTLDRESLPRQRVRTLYQVVKRSLDIVSSVVLLVALFPLLSLIAALVKWTSRGPVLITETRIGQTMQPFEMFKYQTVCVSAATGSLERSADESRDKGSRRGRGGSVGRADVPRLTRLGRFLRQTGLDELPQLCNVLRGEMSLVGPRPPFPCELADYRPWHFRRVLEAKPGITGLWQVAGRSRTTFDEMVRLDLQYVRACSLWTDVKILLATPAAVFSAKGAS